MFELKYWEVDLRDPCKLEFDRKLLQRWENLMKAGHFRYGLEGIHNRVIEGKFGYVAQCQLNRSVLRRPPQAMHGLKQPFDPNKFNFNLIDPEKELICILRKQRRKYWKASEKPDVDDYDYEDSGDRSLIDYDYEADFEDKEAETVGELAGEDRIVSNVSPIDQGHSLLLPGVDLCQPQMLSEQAVILGLEVMFLSTRPDIRICFNSLCAFASVNHLHWHLFYLPHVLYIQTVRLQRLQLKNKMYEFAEDTYPALGWIFIISQPQDIPQVANGIWRLTNWLTEKNIAHNVYMCRGRGEHGEEEQLDHIRIFLWARNNVVGAKDPGAFVMAVCELSGQVLVYQEAEYHRLEEREVAAAQREATHGTFNTIKDDVMRLFS